MLHFFVVVSHGLTRVLADSTGPCPRHHEWVCVKNLLLPWISTIHQDSMPNAHAHLLHIVENTQNVSGLVAVLVFCNQDLWFCIWAILQDSIPSAETF